MNSEQVPTTPRILIVMGVCGSGKTTTGKVIAARLGWKFLEGDEFHPASNVQKMAGGIPLTDSDRAPWLQSMNRELQGSAAKSTPVVLACSALRRGYRRALLAGVESVSRVIHLEGSREVLSQRLNSREGHFMPAGLLDSQLATLEEPQNAIVVDVHLSPEEQAEKALRELSLVGN
jgi:gluconokinase